MLTNKDIKKLSADERLKAIAEIIEDVDRRCEIADGSVTPTLEEMTQNEISAIYWLAIGRVVK